MKRYEGGVCDGESQTKSKLLSWGDYLEVEKVGGGSRGRWWEVGTNVSPKG
jgi:hypothetical protein